MSYDGTKCIRIVNWKGELAIAVGGDVHLVGEKYFSIGDFTFALDTGVPVHYTGKEDTSKGHWCRVHDGELSQ